MDEDQAAAHAETVALDLPAAAAAAEQDLIETPEAFLTGVSAALKASDEVDADLAAILSDNLLTVIPNASVIADARTAILMLAAKRAVPAEEKAHG